jgi:hypothetical protein
MVRKTQSTLAINAKLSSINLLKIETTGETTFGEGMPVAIDSTTYKAAAPDGGNIVDGTAPVVYINWVASDRTDTEFQQGDPSDSTAPTLSIESGGLSCLIGNGIEVGLPASSWYNDTAPTIGDGVQINDTSKEFYGDTITAHRAYYGVVTRVDQGKYYFLFHSTPQILYSD